MSASKVKESNNYDQSWSNYEINNLTVLANQQTGFGPADFKKYFSILNFKSNSFHQIHNWCEDKVGSVLVNLAKKSMANKMKIEREKSYNYFNIPKSNNETEKIPLVAKQDMQWLQRGFFSPVGTMHTFGGLSDGIIESNHLINTCTICNRYKFENNSLQSLRLKCNSKTTACTKCMEVCKARTKIKEIQAKMKSIKNQCRVKVCPLPELCNCRKIGPKKSNITRDRRKL